MSRALESMLFARNLFLPDDLGGNRYPYETVRRLGARGHRVTVVTPRLHGRFPELAGVVRTTGLPYDLLSGPPE